MSLFHKKYPKLSYEVDWELFIFDNLPVKFRQVKIYAYLSTVFNSVNTYYKEFLKQRDGYLKLQNVNGQTMVLEAYLQDYFQDATIYIENSGSFAQSKHLYKPSETPQELEETNLYDEAEFNIQPIDRKTYLFSKSEISSGVDFTVFVPLTILQFTPISQIEGIIERFRFVGTIYKVEGF
tara:strand:+ start:1903 stop:2442 length:540 start_codon:yes stop_codon:yes gene_type:complete